MSFRFTATLPLIALALALAGCHRNGGNSAPPRVDTVATLPSESSTIVVPVSASLADIERALDRQTPRRLWTIDQHQDKCVAARKVNLGLAQVKIVPDLGCPIVTEVRNGAIKVTGQGLFLPVSAAGKATISYRSR